MKKFLLMFAVIAFVLACSAVFAVYAVPDQVGRIASVFSKSEEDLAASGIKKMLERVKVYNWSMEFDAPSDQSAGDAVLGRLDEMANLLEFVDSFDDGKGLARSLQSLKVEITDLMLWDAKLLLAEARRLHDLDFVMAFVVHGARLGVKDSTRLEEFFHVKASDFYDDAMVAAEKKIAFLAPSLKSKDVEEREDAEALLSIIASFLETTRAELVASNQALARK